MPHSTPLISPQSSYASAPGESTPGAFPKYVQQQFRIFWHFMCSLHKYQLMPSQTCSSGASFIVFLLLAPSGGRTLPWMVTNPPTNSSILPVHFPSCLRTKSAALISETDDTKVHRPPSSNIFCRKSSVGSY